MTTPAPSDHQLPPPRPSARLAPIEWALLAAIACMLVVVIVPRLLASRAAENERAARRHCFILAKAERELANKGLPFATPHVLAGGARYETGTGLVAYSPLADSWQGLTAEDEDDAVFGYRFGFFIDEERAHWALVAWPREPGVDGTRLFAVTQEFRVYEYEPPSDRRFPDKEAVAAAAWGAAAAAASPDNTRWRPGWEPSR